MAHVPIRRLKIRAGRVADHQNVSVVLGEEELSTHMAIYGGTGKGKSKFVELMIRQITDQGHGCCLIDPHGDLTEDIIGYVMETKNATSSKIMDRIHYLEPGSPVTRFGFDPFRYQPPDNGTDDYDEWLKAKVESVARIIIRKQGEADFQGRPRLERFLSNVLFGVGTRVNDAGDHLSLADAEVLLSTTHPLHGRVFSVIRPKLPSHVVSDFAKVHASNPRQQEDWVESTIGRLRSFLSPATQSILGGHAETIDFRKIIENHGILLVNLRRSRTFTQDQGNAIGGLVINEILEAAETASRTNRVPFYLIIDEASRFVGQDLIDAFGQFRKWNLSICLAIQDLSSLKQKDIDMTPKVLSQCGVHLSFQQKHPDDLELLSQLLGYPGIDFTRLEHEVDRFNGYKWFEVEETSRASNWSKGDTATRTDTSTRSRASTESSGENWRNDDRSNLGHNRNRSDQNSVAEGNSEAFGNSSQEGGSETVSKKKIPLPQYRTEIRDEGRLRDSVDDQFHKIKQVLRTLDRGQAMGAVDGNVPFVLNVTNVDPAFGTLSPERRMALFDGYKKHLGKHHAYCFAAGDEMTEDERLAKILRIPPSSSSDAPTATPFL